VKNFIYALGSVTAFAALILMTLKSTQQCFMGISYTEFYLNRERNVQNRAKFSLQPYIKCVFSCTDFNENPSYSTLLHVDLKCLIIPKLHIFDNTHNFRGTVYSHSHNNIHLEGRLTVTMGHLAQSR